MSSPLTTPKRYTYLVMGAGSWGTALSLVLARNGHRVHLWSKEATHRRSLRQFRCNQRYLPDATFPDTLDICEELFTAMAQADHILIAVPSHAFTQVLRDLKPYWQPHQGLLWATKGLDPESGSFLSVLADEILGKHIAKAIITGPSFAKEVAANQPTAVTVAGHPHDFIKTIQHSFQSDAFRVYLTDDLMGAQLGGSVKNVLAVAVGVAEGLGYGTNTKAGLMTRGLAEMIRLGHKLGARSDTLIGLSGLGDLILTCSDNQSRNRRFGIAVGQGKNFAQACQEIGQVVEGIPTTHTIYHLAKKLHVDMPITEQMHLLLSQKITPQQAVQALLSRPASHEQSGTAAL